MTESLKTARREARKAIQQEIKEKTVEFDEVLNLNNNYSYCEKVYNKITTTIKHNINIALLNNLISVDTSERFNKLLINSIIFNEEVFNEKHPDRVVYDNQTRFDLTKKIYEKMNELNTELLRNSNFEYYLKEKVEEAKEEIEDQINEAFDDEKINEEVKDQLIKIMEKKIHFDEVDEEAHSFFYEWKRPEEKTTSEVNEEKLIEKVGRDEYYKEVRLLKEKPSFFSWIKPRKKTKKTKKKDNYSPMEYDFDGMMKIMKKEMVS